MVELMKKIRYKHTNLVAADRDKLAKFYENVFGCIRIPPERHLSGEWLAKGTGVKNANFSGVHLNLPGYGKNGPTLEIYQYKKNKPKLRSAANRLGFGHIAFEVENITGMTAKIIENGGSKFGDIVTSKIKEVGVLTFIYSADPEGNIIELQSWK
jgi:predicted enzyme related to lactoylglutathione lyase